MPCELRPGRTVVATVVGSLVGMGIGVAVGGVAIEPLLDLQGPATLLARLLVVRTGEG